MADKIIEKEPSEVRTVTVDFEDDMSDYEDLRTVEITPTKLTGEQIRNYQLDLNDIAELRVQKNQAGQIQDVYSIEVNDDKYANLEILESLDPVEAPEIFVNESKVVEQKVVSFAVQSGANMINYLIQVDGNTTEDNIFSKEILVQVKAE